MRSSQQVLDAIDAMKKVQQKGSGLMEDGPRRTAGFSIHHGSVPGMARPHPHDAATDSDIIQRAMARRRASRNGRYPVGGDRAQTPFANAIRRPGGLNQPGVFRYRVRQHPRASFPLRRTRHHTLDTRGKGRLRYGAGLWCVREESCEPGCLPKPRPEAEGEEDPRKP